MTADTLVEIDRLSVHFTVSTNAWGTGRRAIVRAVDDVSLALHQGETLSLVGESGSGKTTLGRAALRLLEATAGCVRYRGKDLAALRPRELREMRRAMQLVFQDPFASLDPRMTVGASIGEALEIHDLCTDRREDRVAELLELVGLPPSSARRYPHEFSGGQRQRIGIARALAVEPEFIVCDDPVSALDVSIQAQVLVLLIELQRELGLTYLFISHDLAVVRQVSTRVGVMYLGSLVELAPKSSVYERPLHPYTKALLAAVPDPDPAAPRATRIRLRGEVPSPLQPPAGCRFHTRCPFAQELCRVEAPRLAPAGPGHRVACHFWEEIERGEMPASEREEPHAGRR
jgi:oligopeptide/dipeptide ABC transporter ATP-binding protein